MECVFEAFPDILGVFWHAITAGSVDKGYNLIFADGIDYGFKANKHKRSLPPSFGAGKGGWFFGSTFLSVSLLQ